MYTQWNQPQVNVDMSCPFSLTYIDQSTYIDPTYFPNNVPLSVYPEGLKGRITDEQLCFLNGLLRGSLQTRALTNPATIFLYNQMSVNNFVNDDYATLLMSLAEMVINDRSPKAGEADQLQFFVDLATMSMVAVNINRYYKLASVLDQNDVRRYNDMLRMASEITQSATSPLSSQPTQVNRPQQYPHRNGMNRMDNWTASTMGGGAHGAGNPTMGHGGQMTHQPAGMVPTNAGIDPRAFNTRQPSTPQVNVGANRFRTAPAATDDVFSEKFTNPKPTLPEAAAVPKAAQQVKVAASQKELVDTYFDGVLPEGTRKAKNGNDEYVYLYPAEAVKHLPREFNTKITRDSLQRITRMGQHPLCWSPSRESKFYTLTPNGTKVETLVQINEENIMDLNSHVIPGAKVVWETVDTAPVESDGKIINAGADVTVGNMYCSAKTSSICNRIRMRAEEVGDDRVSEYTYDDTEGFIVDNRPAIMKLVSGNVERNNNDNLSDFAAAINGCDAIKGRFRKALDRHCTGIINEFVVYSLGVRVTIDSFLEDIDALLDRIESKEPEETFNALVNNEAEIIRRMATVYTRSQMVKKGCDLNYDVEAAADDKDEVKLVKAIHDAVVLISTPVQVTELPWNFSDCDIDLDHGSIDTGIRPHGLVTADRMPKVLAALKAITGRVGDTRTRSIVLKTQDDVDLSVHRSAYDEDSFILVKE